MLWIAPFRLFYRQNSDNFYVVEQALEQHIYTFNRSNDAIYFRRFSQSILCGMLSESDRDRWCVF